MITLNEVNAYAFSETATKDRPQFSITVKDFVKSKYQRGCFFGLDNLMSQGVYKIHGWCFNLRPFLKKFLYKQYGDWHEVFAPNKTALRSSVYGRIDSIVEMP